MVSESAIKEAAAQTALDTNAVVDVLHRLNTAIGDQLFKQYTRSFTGGGPHNFILEHRDFVVFAYHRGELSDFLDKPATSDAVRAAEIAHSYQAQEKHGFGLSVSNSVLSNLKEPYRVYTPIFVDYPDDWETAQLIGAFRLLESFQWGVTPAEAVDHWLFELQAVDMQKLGGLRDVEYESMRKNVKRAQQKFQNDENQPYYDVNDIRSLNLDQIRGKDALPEDRKLFIYDMGFND